MSLGRNLAAPGHLVGGCGKEGDEEEEGELGLDLGISPYVSHICISSHLSAWASALASVAYHIP